MSWFSEQHVELQDSRSSRDNRDIKKFLDWFSAHPPFQTPQVLQSIFTCVVADEKINCDQATAIGKRAVNHIIGGNFSDVEIKRMYKVKSLDIMSRALKVKENIIPVNPQKLFMRIICVLNNESDFMTYFKYELAPKPPTPFDEISMRKTAKSSFSVVLKSCDVNSENISADFKVVIDGGYLLHALVWPKPTTFDQICETCVTFVQKHFFLTATVVFDGYEECATKGEEPRRRSAERSSTDISIAANNVVRSMQMGFLRNGHNKNGLIILLVTYFRASGHHAIQCSGDADITIAAIALPADGDTHIEVLHPSSGKNTGNIFSISAIQWDIGEIKNDIFFCHAMTGSDTTSAFFGKGKKQVWDIVKSDVSIRSTVNVLCFQTRTKGTLFPLEKSLQCHCIRGRTTMPLWIN
ncbi:hypothetical protein PR048_017180 [Dryococelus australis]|uniref:Uncharacterized protein n=1 Tax=Dryococelus australis TaxID=614101 RepID=A0ABQ9H8S8_9NEOP|nr:hypothetical protein PR048_017180 [Dryococelus australis]